MKGKAIRWSLLTAIAIFVVPSIALAASPTVLTVPWVPSNPTVPHTTYALNSTTEATIIMGATVPSAVGSPDSFTVTWHFADTSADVTFPLTNPYDISTTHQFPATAAVGTIWIATVTVKDTTNSTSGSANYYVIQESNDCTKLNAQKQPICLASRVNVAIDWGLWYMHQTMWRVNANANGKGNPPVNWGGWDIAQSGSPGCNAVHGSAFDCGYYGVSNAENVQAFEVNGHLQSGFPNDPYSDDVARGLARATNFIANMAVATDTYQYDPSKEDYTCANGTVPQTTDLGACTGNGGRHYYIPAATSCTSPPCVMTYDANKNGLAGFSSDGSGEPIYTSAPFIDMLVAAGTPNALVPTGAYAGQTFKTTVQDIMDYYAYSQYGDDFDVDRSSTRGASQDQGGAWLYVPQQGDDNSTSQWAAIGLISGLRGLGLAIPKSVTDFNDVWITNAQDLQDPAPIAPVPPNDPVNLGDNLGAYGYRGSLHYSNAAGPFAVSPSAMVQMALDGIGRTSNTAFGDASTAFDQRWNTSEAYYADNFCNKVSDGPTLAPRAYMYGMFSFTKSMLLHNEGGTLAAIQYLRTLTPGVFSGNSNVPKNTIDWYAALSSTNGGLDPCDGVAQTLIDFQQTPVSPAVSGSSNFGQADFDGHWYGNTYYVAPYYQSAFETAWALIMLKGTVFVQCVNNLSGRGYPGIGVIAPRIDLTWTNQANATSYVVSRSSTNGGPYTKIGTTTSTAYSDRAALADGSTFYYIVDPEISGTEVCQSNQAVVTVPGSR